MNEPKLPLAVGDRVKVYAESDMFESGTYISALELKATVVEVTTFGLKLNFDGSYGGVSLRYWHPKQVRRLVPKKPRRRILVWTEDVDALKDSARTFRKLVVSIKKIIASDGEFIEIRRKKK